MNRLPRRLIAIQVLLVSLGSIPIAMAAEEPPVVRALLDSTAVGGTARPTYDSLDVAADGTIRIGGLTTTFEPGGDPDAAVSYEVGEVVLSDVKELGDGLFEVGAAEWVGMKVTGGTELLATVPVVMATSLYLHQPAAAPSAIERLRASNVIARTFSVPEATVLVGSQSIVLEDMNGTWDGDPMTGAGTSRFAARRIVIAGAVFEGDDNPLALAGYSELELAIEGTSVTVYSGEALGFDLEMRFEASDMGRLIIEVGADGIPLALFGALDAGEPDPDALLAMSDGVQIKRARIRFEDNSLTRRVLTLLAEAEGRDVASFVADGTQGLDMMLQESLDPDLARQVSTALTAYLNDPQSFTLALAPAQPVTFAQIMTGLADPATLIDLLQASITAND